MWIDLVDCKDYYVLEIEKKLKNSELGLCIVFLENQITSCNLEIERAAIMSLVEFTITRSTVDSLSILLFCTLQLQVSFYP